MNQGTSVLGAALLAAVATLAAESAPPIDVAPGKAEYHQLRQGLGNCKATFTQTKAGRVAFLGGSITYNGGWRDELMRYLQQRFPETTFDFIAAGIPSLGSNAHVFRLERDVLARGPVDLLFVEAAVNDATNIPDQPELMLRAMEGLVRHLRAANPLTDIVAMHFVTPEAIAVYTAGGVPVPEAQHERVAEYYGCPSLNLTLEVSERIKAGEFTWASAFGDVHPPPTGQRLYANSMMRMLDTGFARAGTPTAHALPDRLLDPYSYTQGHFGKLQAATLGQGFALDPAWKPTRPAGTRDGFVNVPALTATAPGAELSYDFTGTAIGLLLAAGPDSCILEFSIDGAATKRVDTFSAWSTGLYLPWPIMLADTLTPGPHTVTVRTTAQAEERTGLHIIQILVN
jgi:sialidase-1